MINTHTHIPMYAARSVLADFAEGNCSIFAPEMRRLLVDAGYNRLAFERDLPRLQQENKEWFLVMQKAVAYVLAEREHRCQINVEDTKGLLHMVANVFDVPEHLEKVCIAEIEDQLEANYAEEIKEIEQGIKESEQAQESYRESPWAISLMDYRRAESGRVKGE
jgi:hypothetical protein